MFKARQFAFHDIQRANVDGGLELAITGMEMARSGDR
jgi:hypothetical protein